MQKARSGPKHSLTFRNKYLAVVMSVAAFFLSFSSFGQGAAPPGYAPKVQSYGNWYNRLRADSAQHIPNKACLCKNDNDTTPQLFIYMDTLRGFWNGVFHNIGFGSGGGSGIDTIFVTQIGTGSPQIPLVYAVNGNLRVARLVPGVFTIPVMNADSAVHIDIDTTGPGGAAYKQWVINLISSGFNSLQQVISNNDTLRKDDTIELNQHNLLYHSTGAYNEYDIQMINGIFQTSLQTTASVMSWVTTDGTTTNSVNIQAGQHSYSSSQGSKFNQFIISPDSVSLAATNGTTDIFSLTATTARLKGLPHANDTTARKPVAIGTDGTLVVMDGWAGSSGGAADVVTTITSGTSSTVPNGTNIIRFNSTGVLTYTLTLPTTWSTTAGSYNDLVIAFTSNGTITNGNPMVNLTVVNGSGHTLSYSVNPNRTYNAGESLRFHLISTIEQCYN